MPPLSPNQQVAAHAARHDVSGAWRLVATPPAWKVACPPRLRQAQSRAAPALTLPPRAPRPQEQEARALEEEARRLKRERGALAKQGRALLALPTKRERGQARPNALMPVG